MAIKKDTLDGLLAGRDPQAVFAKDGLFDGNRYGCPTSLVASG